MSFESTRKNWEGLAQKDALWSICTHPDKTGNRWNTADFFATGEKEISTIFQLLSDNQIDVSKDHALDFGCGVGRISRALSSRFAQVTGIDVSPTMIQKAQDMHAGGFAHIHFKVNDTYHLQQFEDSTFDFVFTTIVLQHISYPEQLDYLKEFLRVLKAGGLLVFQVPTRDIRQLSFMTKLKSQLRLRERLALLGIGQGYHMEMNVLSPEEIREALQSSAGEILLTELTNHTDPAFDGSIQFLKDKEAIDFHSSLYIVRKL